MFSQACVKNYVHGEGGGHAWQGSVHERGCMVACVARALHGRRVCGGHGWGYCVAGVCMAGGMHGRGYAWQGVCMAGGMHGRGHT